MGIDPRGLAQAMGDAEARLNAVRKGAEAAEAKAAALDACVTHLTAELADAKHLLGLAMNRISGERGTVNHDLNKRIADFLVLKREFRPSQADGGSEHGN